MYDSGTMMTDTENVIVRENVKGKVQGENQKENVKEIESVSAGRRENLHIVVLATKLHFYFQDYFIYPFEYLKPL